MHTTSEVLYSIDTLENSSRSTTNMKVTQQLAIYIGKPTFLVPILVVSIIELDEFTTMVTKIILCKEPRNLLNTETYIKEYHV